MAGVSSPVLVQMRQGVNAHLHARDDSGRPEPRVAHLEHDARTLCRVQRVAPRALHRLARGQRAPASYSRGHTHMPVRQRRSAHRGAVNAFALLLRPAPRPRYCATWMRTPRTRAGFGRVRMLRTEPAARRRRMQSATKRGQSIFVLHVVARYMLNAASLPVACCMPAGAEQSRAERKKARMDATCARARVHMRDRYSEYSTDHAGMAGGACAW